MEHLLKNFLLLNGKISEEDSDSFIYDLLLEEENISTLSDLINNDLVEGIKDRQKRIIIIDDLTNFKNQIISIEFIKSELEKIGFYLTFNDFIISNRFEVPSEFYINEILYSNSSQVDNEKMNKYKAITALINRLTSKAKFVSEEYIKTICLIQENSFIEIPIETILYEECLEQENIDLINQYVEDIDSYKEKRTIFLKELIDFLNNKPKNARFNDLISSFREFYEKCNTSFEYYLSNFSFNKIKLELDNSVLEYSKNIRSIINESQSKLIAIPAAFILGVSQIDFENPFGIKNIFIVASAFLFSYIISVFINNQKNAIEIISDNLTNYKTNYKRSKATQFEEEKELITLSELINNSFEKIEIEISKQEERIKILSYCTWGISIVLLGSIVIVALIKIKCG